MTLARTAIGMDALGGDAPLHDVYTRVRAGSEAWAAPLSAEDQLVQSMDDVSPTKWHLAHTTWFWEQFVLRVYEEAYQSFDDQFDYLFNSYYEALGARHPRPRRGLLSRPRLDEVMAYRAHVDAAMASCVERHAGDPAFDAVMATGLAHEQQHQELILTDIKHVLAAHPFAPAAYRRGRARAVGAAMSWRAFEGGLLWFGAEPDSWAFDNETPRHRAFVEPFELADRPVTNGEVEAFIADGGYETAALWLSDGWAHIQHSGDRAPLYWRGGPGEWRQFTLHGEEPLDAHAPACHLSYFEADAVARWMGARLPDEREWEHAARISVAEGAGLHDGQFSEPGVAPHPRARIPLDDTDLRPSDGRPRLHHMFGGVWEWTRSAYAAYPGYQATRDALGEYNGKFMCAQFVLRGGSCATPRRHMRVSYRNFHYPAAQWQMTGLRLARDAG